MRAHDFEVGYRAGLKRAYDEALAMMRKAEKANMMNEASMLETFATYLELMTSNFVAAEMEKQK